MSENSQINWEIYEGITRYIYESLGAQDGIKVIGFGRTNNLEGKSGVKHQVDVLTEEIQAGNSLLTAIECKYWNDKVDKDVVMKLSEIMSDLDIANGIIVCKSGYTRDTVKYAQHKGIRLVKLWETDEKDTEYMREVELGILEFNFQITQRQPNITSINFGSRTIHFDPKIGDVYHLRLYDESGNEYSLKPLLFEFEEKLKWNRVPLENTTIEYTLGGNLFLQMENEKILVNKLSVSGFISIVDHSTVKSFTLTDQVWLIMEELFNRRRLTMFRSGLIWHLPKEEN